MLVIKNLHVAIEDKPILRGVNLTITQGEVHAIMGPNGSGKSTLAAVLAGKEGYDITEGEIWYQGENIIDLAPEERAHKGIFLGFQYPVAIPGLNMVTFLQASVNAIRTAQNQPILNAVAFLKYIKEKAALLDIDGAFLKRGVNEGFSGGEKKRHECLQLLCLAPTLAILDETDSGLDIDALRVVADGVNHFASPSNSLVLITHYQRMLNYIVPDRVSILYQGQVIKTGDRTLAQQLEQEGYSSFIEAAQTEC